jgi:hypothetical protein
MKLLAAARPIAASFACLASLTGLAAAASPQAPGADPKPAPAPSVDAAPTPGQLLVDGATRERFLARWSPAFLRLRYQAAPAEGEDPDMRPWLTTLALLVEGDGGAALIAPTHRLAGVAQVTLQREDGRELAARVIAAPDAQRIPFVRLVPDDPKALAGLTPLRWHAPGDVQEGLRVWGVEWPEGATVPDGKVHPVLVDAAIGERVEHPLDRFWYVALRSADGLALLTADGKVVCAVFRRVPGTERSSLCSPADAALAIPPAPDRVKTEKVDLRVL